MSQGAMPLEEWHWDDTSLEKPPRRFDPNDSLDLTSHVVEQLRTAKYNDVRDLIESVTDLKRLIRLKELRENGEKKPPKIDLDRQQKMSALAAFVTITQTNTESCKQCSNKKSRGPCAECIAGGDDLFNGACTNCQFSSTASACSFYKGVMGKKRKRAGRGSSPGASIVDRLKYSPTPEMLAEMTTGELERVRRIIDTEIRSREELHTRDHWRRP